MQELGLRKRLLQQAVSGIALFFLSASAASAATYYVRTDGNNGNAGTANTTGGGWQTINYAAGHVAAGDIVRVQAGTYVEQAAPSISGASGNTVTLVADGAVTTCGMRFNAKSYIRVVGFTMNASTAGCSNSPIVAFSGTNTGLEFWNDNVGNLNGHGYLIDQVGSGAVCNACIWIGGSIHDLGNPGSATGLVLDGSDDFVGYVNFSTIDYIAIQPGGSRQRFINLNFSGMIENGTHPDFYYVDENNSSLGWSTNLVESNFGVGTITATDNKFFHSDTSPVAMTDNLWRQNVSYNMGSAFYSLYPPNTALRWRFYNNTHVNCNRAATGSDCGTFSANSTLSASIYNELFYQGWSDGETMISGWGTGGSPTLTYDYNLAYSPNGAVSFFNSWTAQAHAQSNVDPKLNNVASQDFTLQSASGARSVGGPLTAATGSGSNSTSLTVAPNTGSFFIGSNASNLPQYGGNLAPGDFITVGSTTVQVSSVTGDVLTLASPISWNSGAPVYFGSSSTIDIGAYPYKSGYSLNAYFAITGGTATVTPNDASLVRFVVCYSDNVPYAVSNSSPYTCGVPSGTFSARVYPRYASQMTGVTVGTGLSPAAPTNPKIIP